MNEAGLLGTIIIIGAKLFDIYVFFFVVVVALTCELPLAHTHIFFS